MIMPQASPTAVFSEYKRRTGAWPMLSMAAYYGRYLLMFGGLSWLFWFGRSHPEEMRRVTLYFFGAFLIIIFLWNLIESLAWNYDLRRNRLASVGTFYGARQFPRK